MKSDCLPYYINFYVSNLIWILTYVLELKRNPKSMPILEFSLIWGPIVTSVSTDGSATAHGEATSTHGWWLCMCVNREFTHC